MAKKTKEQRERERKEYWDRLPRLSAGSVSPEKQHGVIRAREDDRPRDMTLVNVLRAGQDLRAGRYIDVLNNVIAAAGLFAGMKSKPRDRTGAPDTISAQYLRQLGLSNPSRLRDALSDDAVYAAYTGLNNVRAATQANFRRALASGALIAPSSALVPAGRPPQVANGYQGGHESGGVRIYLTPEWSRANQDKRIVTFRGDAYTASTSEFVRRARPGMRNYVPRAYQALVPLYDRFDLADGTFAEQYRNAVDAALFRARRDRNLALSDANQKLANGMGKALREQLFQTAVGTLDPDVQKALAEFAPSSYSRDTLFYMPYNTETLLHIGRPDAKGMSGSLLHPTDDASWLAQMALDYQAGKSVSFRLMRHGFAGEFAGKLSPPITISRGRASSMDEYGPGKLNIHPSVGSKFSDILRTSLDSYNQNIASLPPDPSIDLTAMSTLKQSVFKNLANVRDKAALVDRAITTLRPTADRYLGDDIARSLMRRDLSDVEPLRNVPYVTDASQGLPYSFYAHLGRHRYLENKVYGRVPLRFSEGAIGGVGIENTGTELMHDIQRTLDRFGIPHREYNRWGETTTEQEVQKNLAPVIHMAAKGGNAPGVSDEVPPQSGAPVPQGGPRIVVNPSTFRNEKDALCVAFNEAFRVVMEDMEFEPVSEPTERQRRFFSDTAYADDEEQMRRTILARICTFDTSVQDPTDEQIQEAVEFLTSVMEAGYPENEWEQSAVMRIRDALAEAAGGGQARAPEGSQAVPGGRSLQGAPAGAEVSADPGLDA